MRFKKNEITPNQLDSNIANEFNNALTKFMTLKEVASVLSCSTAYIYKLNRDKTSKFPKGKRFMGTGSLVWDKEELLNYLNNWMKLQD